MGFWEKSVRIFNYLCEAGTQSVRRLAQHTGVSKSSAHRLTQAMMHRDIHPESWLWETAEGRRWLTRLVVATLYTFGLKRGVGLDTISKFSPTCISRCRWGVLLEHYEASCRR